MKHTLDARCRTALSAGVTAMGLSVSTPALETMAAYLERILDQNAEQNLTSIHDPWNAVRLHLLDSLAAVPEVNAAPSGLLLDIGTGGGFPGVPLALASGREAVLLDSQTRKARAVAAAVAEVGLTGVGVVAARAEEYALGAEGAFAVVVARAVAPIASLLELAAPLLAPGGRAVLLKGSPSSEEIQRGERAALVIGLEPDGTRELELPDGGEHRTVISFRKCRSASIPLPRRVGVAQKRPLG